MNKDLIKALRQSLVSNYHTLNTFKRINPHIVNTKEYKDLLKEIKNLERSIQEWEGNK